MRATEAVRWFLIVSLAVRTATGDEQDEDHDHCSIDLATCDLVGSEEVAADVDTSTAYYFCSDRYTWQWSSDASSLPGTLSDSICMTMDADEIEDLPSTRVLVLGGCNAETQVGFVCPSLSSDTLLYDPEADTFDDSPVAMPTTRYRVAAASIGKYVYVFGGRDVEGELVCDIDRYDAVANEWMNLGTQDADTCFSDHQAFAGDDGSTIYIVGGYDAEYATQATTVKVTVADDFETLTFEAIDADLLQDRGDHVCLKVPEEGSVYCMGGFQNVDEDFVPLDTVETFDIATEAWTSVASMNKVRADFAVGYMNGRVTVAGGENFDGALSDVEWYDPDGDCWVESNSIFSIPYDRLRYCGATILDPEFGEHRMYIFGGQTGPADGDVYTVKEDVNWYQEVLVDSVDEASTGAAASVIASGPGALATAAAATAATLAAAAAAGRGALPRL